MSDLYTSSTDPAALAVLAQLEGVGCPPPSETQEIVANDGPGGDSWHEAHWIWQTPKGEYDCDVYLALLMPKTVQATLIQYGVSGIQPVVGTLTSPIGPRPTPTVVPAKPALSQFQTTSPIGAKRADGTFDAQGGFNLPLGFVWTQGGVKYTLGGSPFNELWTAAS